MTTVAHVHARMSRCIANRRMAAGERRGILSRERILATALEIADTHGPDALPMRRVATELGVDPMALYRHVRNKDALLDGVVERLWDEVPPPRRDGNWVESLRAFGVGLRAVIDAHPRTSTLLLTRRILPRRPLEAYDTLLGNLRDAGYDDTRATQILRSVISTAYADAFATLTYRCLAAARSDADALITMSQLLPPDTPPHLVRTAHTICGTCEPGADFTFVLDLILAGAQDLPRHHQTANPPTPSPSRR